MKPKHLPESYEFLPDKFFPRLVYGSGRARAFLLCLDAGQGLAPREDSEEMICYVVDGKAKLRIGGDEFEVSGGDLAGAGAGEVRGIEAQERCVALWVHLSAGGSDDE